MRTFRAKYKMDPNYALTHFLIWQFCDRYGSSLDQVLEKKKGLKQ